MKEGSRRRERGREGGEGEQEKEADSEKGEEGESVGGGREAERWCVGKRQGSAHTLLTIFPRSSHGT